MSLQKYRLSILLLAFTCHCTTHGMGYVRQMPQPDLSALKDDTGTLPVSDSYLAAAMPILHHYIENMQYEQLPVQSVAVTTKRPPTTTVTQRTTKMTTTTRRPVAITTTTRRQPITHRTTTKPSIQKWPTTASPHKPGVHAPNRPPYYVYFGIPMKPEPGFHKPGIVRPQFGGTSPSLQDSSFTQWFFQTKVKEIEDLDENELQYLDVLPKKLLLDILHEPYYPPKYLDIDNVNEFRKKYDDSFYRPRVSVPNKHLMKMNMRIQMMQQKLTLTGKKKPPPVGPYVKCIMLYDRLKAEAKAQKLHLFGGFSKELLRDLHASAQHTGVYQLKYVLEKMLQRKEVSNADIISRTKTIIDDLNNPKSDAFKALTIIPPLQFLP